MASTTPTEEIVLSCGEEEVERHHGEIFSHSKVKDSSLSSESVWAVCRRCSGCQRRHHWDSGSAEVRWPRQRRRRLPPVAMSGTGSLRGRIVVEPGVVMSALDERSDIGGNRESSVEGRTREECEWGGTWREEASGATWFKFSQMPEPEPAVRFSVRARRSFAEPVRTTEPDAEIKPVLNVQFCT
ncbi:hypothetical protein B0H16DRAFT_1460470 [Mycena metata]|uniref:Uncharacterized protein n=1 Tax=Mycena metata TaxID=1033252 RepID=A0AAD7N9B2_9AGAR|nr:hypothetical protein B0H16DRAFT_1460470 [Mycena metata]